MLRLEDIECSAQVSSSRNASRGNRHTTGRTIPRSTTCGNLNISRHHNRHIQPRRDCCMAFLHHCHFVRIRFGRMNMAWEPHFTSCWSSCNTCKPSSIRGVRSSISISLPRLRPRAGSLEISLCGRNMLPTRQQRAALRVPVRLSICRYQPHT